MAKLGKANLTGRPNLDRVPGVERLQSLAPSQPVLVLTSVPEQPANTPSP